MTAAHWTGVVIFALGVLAGLWCICRLNAVAERKWAEVQARINSIDDIDDTEESE